MNHLDLNEIPPNFKIKTRKGFIFTYLAKDTWKDETSGLTWLPIESGKYDHYQAEKLQDDTKRLPTKEEFEEAESHGIREVYLSMRDNWYWSASVYPDYTGYAYYFNGDSNGAVLCVGR